MECERIKRSLWAYITKSLDEEQYKEVKNHLNLCKECYNEYKEHERLWELLNNLVERKPKTEIERRVFKAISEETAKEKRIRINLLNSMLRSIIFGIFITLLGLLIVSFKVNLGDVKSFGVMLFALLWIIAFSTAFFFITRQTAGKGIDFSAISKIALFSVATRILLDYICPMSFAMKVFGIKEMTALVCFYFGAIYSLLPVLIITFKLGEEILLRPLAHILLISFVFIVIISPYSYIIEHEIEHALVLILSTALGALIGSFSGYVLKTRTLFL